MQTCADTSPADTRRARLRALARTTWLPRLPPCMMYRFVAGRLGSHAVQVEEEGRVHGDFMLLDHEVWYMYGVHGVVWHIVHDACMV